MANGRIGHDKSDNRFPNVRSRSCSNPGSIIATFVVSPCVLPIVLPAASNLFMTLACYGHRRFKDIPLAGVIVARWLIAVANRWASALYTTAQLKTIQDVITLLGFAGFSSVALKEPITGSRSSRWGSWSSSAAPLDDAARRAPPLHLRRRRKSSNIYAPLS
jgi:uncharacterized protein (DUF486 family)